jgi:glycosyltransferase involved in cell wall biosynthesis
LTRRSWTINGDFVSLSPTGVARYAREVTRALDELVSEKHPLTRDLELNVVAPLPLSLTAIPVTVVPEFRHPRLPQFWVQCQFPLHVRGGVLSFCNLAPVALSRQIVCIHDLHTFIMPESYGRGFRLAHRIVLPLLGKRAARITTVSELSREHLIQYAIADSKKIVVAHNGADHALRWNASRSTLSFDQMRPFVLFFWRSQKYKNNELIKSIAGPLDAQGIDIVIVGETPQQDDSWTALSGMSNIKHVGRIDDDTLAQALSKALCLIFPSRIEGFGLPAVEGMTLGCPLVASTARCLPEICGDGALYADPDDPSEWIDAITRIKSDKELRADLVVKGRRQASAYSWRKVAETYLGLMADIDSERGQAGLNAALKPYHNEN